tara:strand:+ start:724 stop:1245 length:522 start_codon:yes stop_codon:yes gene_type:complete
MSTTNFNRQDLIDKIETSYRNFKNALSQFSEKELNSIPFEGSWTAGQVTEHLSKSNAGILNQLLNGKAETTNRDADKQVELIQGIFRGSEKMKTAPVLEPKNPPHSLQELLKILEEQKEQQLETVKNKDLKSLIPELEFPPSPEGLTRLEWMHLMIEHTNRHKKQIETIHQKQ